MQATTNNTSDTDRKATVSIRNMPLSVWRKARKIAIDKQISMTQYIISLIEQDTSNE